jgi:hypothetical protein
LRHAPVNERRLDKLDNGVPAYLEEGEGVRVRTPRRRHDPPAGKRARECDDRQQQRRDQHDIDRRRFEPVDEPAAPGLRRETEAAFAQIASPKRKRRSQRRARI